MSPTKEVRYTSHSVSPSPHGRSRSVSPSPRRRSRSRSFSRDRSYSPSRERGSLNPGNNLYVTGLSTRVTSSDLEKYFSKEGKVADCEVIRDPRTRESRGFGFVTMESADDADRCVRYLNRSVLEGRLITVEKVSCISTELTIYASNSLYSPFSTCSASASQSHQFKSENCISCKKETWENTDTWSVPWCKGQKRSRPETLPQLFSPSAAGQRSFPV